MQPSSNEFQDSTLKFKLIGMQTHLCFALLVMHDSLIAQDRLSHSIQTLTINEVLRLIIIGRHSPLIIVILLFLSLCCRRALLIKHKNDSLKIKLMIILHKCDGDSNWAYLIVPIIWVFIIILVIIIIIFLWDVIFRVLLRVIFRDWLPRVLLWSLRWCWDVCIGLMPRVTNLEEARLLHVEFTTRIIWLIPLIHIFL